MRGLTFFTFLLLPVFLSAQLIFSRQVEKSGYSDALQVEVWGDEYLLRTDNFSTSPVDFADYLLLVGEIGFPIWENPMNPYERQSHSTLTAFTVLSDSSAVALAVDTNPLTGPSRSLLRFNRSGDITEIEELPTDDSSSLSPYDLCSAEDSTVFFTEIVTDIEGFRGIKIIAFGANLVEEYTATIAREGANTYGNALYAEPDGTLFFIHTTSGTPLEYLVTKIDPNGAIVSERPVASPHRRNYVAVLPIGENGVALLEGLDVPDIICGGWGCDSEFGRLLIYRDATSPAEVYDLNFSPFGMELLENGELFVYGTTALFETEGNGVLFKPTGWPDGNRTHLLEDPNTADLGAVSYNRIYGMSVADNGDLVGTGVVGYGNGTTNGTVETHWLFRIGANGCFTEDCSDLLGNPDDLVPLANQPDALIIKTHPNPFTSTLNFTAPDSRSNDPATVSLYDVSGRLLRSGKLEDGLEWETEDLAPGMYVVAFTNGEKRGVVKVVKQ